MPDARELPIDLEELAEAMDMGTRDTVEFYLDTQTGELVVTGDGVDEEDEVDLDADGGERYVEVPTRTPADGYAIMRDFIDRHTDGRLADRLSQAITGSGAFRRFKNELSAHPEAQARWYQFRSDAIQQDTIDWLESLNIRPVRKGAGPKTN